MVFSYPPYLPIFFFIERIIIMKKIKKILRKLYHLLAIFSCFILFLIPVCAEELDSCYSDYLVDYSIGNHNYIPLWNKNNQTWTYVPGSAMNGSKPFQVLIPLYADKSTYLKFPVSASGNNIDIWGGAFYDENLTNTQTVSQSRYIYDYISYSYDNTTNILTITPRTSTYSYASFTFNTFLSYNNYSRPVPWGSQTSGQVAIADFDLSNCPVSLDPDQPVNNNVFSNFLTLYINKLTYLANGFIENPYLLVMIGIIFSFIILELFLADEYNCLAR